MRARLLAALPLLCAIVPARASSGEKDVCIQAAEDGQKLRAARKLVEAGDRLIQCARDACPAMIRKDCAQWLAEVRSTTPTVVFAAKDEGGRDVVDVRVSVDGTPLVDKLDGASIPVDPGTHTFRYERPGSAPLSEAIVVREGEKSRLLGVAFPKASEAPKSRSGIPAGVFIFGGVAVLGGATFAVLAASGKSDVDTLRATCAPNCSESALDQARTKIIVANVALGVGIASVGVATWILLSRGTEGKSTAVGVAPVAGGGVAQFAATY